MNALPTVSVATKKNAINALKGISWLIQPHANLAKKIVIFVKTTLENAKIALLDISWMRQLTVPHVHPTVYHVETIHYAQYVTMAIILMVKELVLHV